MNRPLDVLQGLFAHIVESKVQAVTHVIANGTGDRDPPGLAMLSNLAATLTPSPKMSSPSTITSPAVSNNVGGKNSGEAAFHFSSQN